jgi:hypothetical protein
MPGHIYRKEIAGEVRVGLEFVGELVVLEKFLASKGIVLVYAYAPAPAPRPETAEPQTLTIDRRGRPSRDEEIAAAIDALDDELDRCGSIKAQARAVRTYLEKQDPDREPPGLSTVETYISVYRKPRRPGALKIAKKYSGG